MKYIIKVQNKFYLLTFLGNIMNETNIKRNRIIENKYNLGNGGIKAWFEKVSLLWIVQLKKIVKTPMTWFGVVGIPLILLFGIGALVQDGALLTPCFGMVPIVVSGVVFGDLYYSMENSTLKQSTNTTNYGHKTKLFTIATVTFIVALLSVLFELSIFIFFESLDWFFMPGFVFFNDAHYQALTIEWLALQWGNLLYYLIANIILTIAMLIFVKNFFATNKTFTMFILVYVLLDIVFGGVLVMNYNQAVVEIENGQVKSTGYISNLSVLLGEKESPWKMNRLYDYTKFLIPHYFLNQQFSTLLKAGSVQQNGAFWFDAAGVYHINWDLGIEEINEIGYLSDYSWMLNAQNMIFGTPTNITLKSNVDFHVAFDALDDYSGTYKAFYTFNRALPADVSFWKPYNNDYTFILSEVLPWVYIIVFTWVGFVTSRVTDKN